MNFEKQQFIVTSVIYRIFRKRPEIEFDSGTCIWTSVWAINEEDAKKIAEDQVRRDFAVDEYEFVKIQTYDEWMGNRMEEGAE